MEDAARRGSTRPFSRSGKSLRQVLDEQRRLSPAFTMHIGKCMAVALDCAHRANLVHRDVKPGNVLLADSGSVKLADFGLVRRWDGEESRATATDVVVGTWEYLSPEQALSVLFPES